MDNSKLKEALVDLQRQRAIVDEAIEKLKQVIEMMNGGGDELAMSAGPGLVRVGVRRPFSGRSRRTGSYIDDGVEVLAATGKPVHIKEIVQKIGDMRHKKVARASVESSFIRHIKDAGESSRIVKVSPGFFGLPNWGIEQQPLGLRQ